MKCRHLVFIIFLILAAFGLAACERQLGPARQEASPAAPKLPSAIPTRPATMPVKPTSTPIVVEPKKSPTPIVVAPTEAGSPQPQVTEQPPVNIVEPSATPLPSPTAQPPAPRPATYRLHRGEYPYCIARRYNLDPIELMAINGFWPWQIFYTGQELVIPQSGWTWPGNRALIPHPAQYVVGWNDTIYSVACFFGDVDPEALAAANGLQPPYRLQIGQVLNVP